MLLSIGRSRMGQQKTSDLSVMITRCLISLELSAQSVSSIPTFTRTLAETYAFVICDITKFDQGTKSNF